MNVYLSAGDISTVQCQIDSTSIKDFKGVRLNDYISLKGVVTGALSDEVFGINVKLFRCVLQ